MKKFYDVTITVPVDVRVHVMASSEDMASEIALNHFSGLSIEWNGSSAFITDDCTSIEYASDCYEVTEVSEVDDDGEDYVDDDYDVDEEDEEDEDDDEDC